MAKAERRERSTALYETILKLRDLEECRRFFEDLCTPTELQAMEQRFDVAVYLQQGLVYLDILEKTGASSATISRVRRSMLENGAGGVVQSIIIREGLDKPGERRHGHRCGRRRGDALLSERAGLPPLRPGGQGAHAGALRLRRGPGLRQAGL